MGQNSNERNGSINNCRKNACSQKWNKKPRKTTARGNDTKYYFEHGDKDYRKACDMYRADEGKGHCMRCVKGKTYKHGHHETCPHSMKYCDRKQCCKRYLNSRTKY